MENSPATDPRPRRVAVLLAGGVGVRIGLDIPKQLIKVAGRTLLEHSLAALHQHPLVDGVLVMMAPGHLDAVRAIVRDGDYHKVEAILEGGATRNETTERALAALGPEESHVLFHDAVRPLVAARIITECFEALEVHPAVDVAIPSADTIIEVGPDNTIREIPPRAALRRGQTPQAFRASVIRRAYAEAAQDPAFEATDDCTVVLRYLPDEPIWVVRGEERNMKVTEPIDVYLADKLFQLTSTDAPDPVTAEPGSSLAGKTVVVFGGSYGIGADVAGWPRRRVRTSSPSAAPPPTPTWSAGPTWSPRRRGRSRRPAASTTSSTPPACFPAAPCWRPARRPSTPRPRSTTSRPIFIAQVMFPHLAATGGSLLLFTSSSYTRGRSGYSLYSSAKAATVNLTQALADEWASDRVRVNCVNPERTSTPMRTRAFGSEPSDSLLESEVVARTSLDVLVSDFTGHVVDVRMRG